MSHNDESEPFCKAILTGLFAGFVASVLCLVYDLVFRYSTYFPDSTMINISSIIFGINLFLLVAGVVFFYLKRMGRTGVIIFISLFLLATIFCLFKASALQTSDDHELNQEFRSLLTGIVIITGLAASALIPFLFYNKGFNEHVLNNE